MPGPALLEWVHRQVGHAGWAVLFMRDQLGKPIPSPVVLGQITEKFREAVKAYS